MESTFEGSGIEYTIEVAPVPPDTDFTPFVRAMSDFGAEMIVGTGHPPGNSAIVRLSADLAGNVPVTGAWIPPDLAVGGLQDLAIGRYSDFACADYLSDSYADLARRYLAFSDNLFMSDDAVAGYAIVQIVAEAVGEVGDDPAAYRAKVEAEIRAQIQSQAPAQPQFNVPASLNGARSVATRSAPAWTGPPPLESIFGN